MVIRFGMVSLPAWRSFNQPWKSSRKMSARNWSGYRRLNQGYRGLKLPRSSGLVGLLKDGIGTSHGQGLGPPFGSPRKLGSGSPFLMAVRAHWTSSDHAGLSVGFVVAMALHQVVGTNSP